MQKATGEYIDKLKLEKSTSKIQTRRHGGVAAASGAQSVAVVITEVVKALKPVIVQSVSPAVTQAVNILSDKFVNEIKHQNAEAISNLKKQPKKQSYQLERMEEYTRRDNIRMKRVKTPMKLC